MHESIYKEPFKRCSPSTATSPSSRPKSTVIMVLKLHGYSKSTCTRLVGLVCKEKEIPFEFVPVDLSKREQRSAEFIKHQPFGQVPYIVRLTKLSSV